MKEEQIKNMANRFLGWELPKDFNPDGGISYTSNKNNEMPRGTHLFTAIQAEEMVRFMLKEIPYDEKII